MNKQEKEELVNQLNGRLTNCPSDSWDKGYNEGIKTAVRVARNLPTVDEPQKVKVKPFVAEWFEENKSDLDRNLWALTITISEKRESSYFKLTSFERWFFEESETYITLVRMLDGYEVEEAAEWIVRVKGMYFMNWGEDGTCPTFVIDDNPRAKLLAKPFIKSEAQSLAEALHGSIEKV